MNINLARHSIAGQAGAHDRVRYYTKAVTVPISATNLDRPRHVRFPPLATELRTLLEVRFVPSSEVTASNIQQNVAFRSGMVA
jgi:hypothetical protein